MALMQACTGLGAHNVGGRPLARHAGAADRKPVPFVERREGPLRAEVCSSICSGILEVYC
jgi:hypothetical protein